MKFQCLSGLESVHCMHIFILKVFRWCRRYFRYAIGCVNFTCVGYFLNQSHPILLLIRPQMFVELLTTKIPTKYSLVVGILVDINY